MKRLAVLSCLALAALSVAQVGLRVKHLSSKKKDDYEAKAAYPVFSGTPLAVFANRVWKSKAVSDYKLFIKGAIEARAEERKGGYQGMPHTYDSVPSITYKHAKLLSGNMLMQTYTGGAHGMYWPEQINIAVVSGRPMRIGLKELLKPEIDPMTTVSPLVIKKLLKRKAAWVENGDVKALKKEQLDQFVATRYGLRYMFAPYEMGSYAEGMYEVTLTWKEVDTWLDRSGPAGVLPPGK